jgi:predicted RNA-binding protein YlqC (UPF0109 family)
MIELVKYLSQSIVNFPDDVVVKEETAADGTIEVSLKVNPEDMKIVIGKSGRNIKAIRTLVRLSASIKNQKVRLNLEEGTEQPA